MNLNHTVFTEMNKPVDGLLSYSQVWLGTDINKGFSINTRIWRVPSRRRAVAP